MTSLMIVMSNGSSFMGRYLSFLYIPMANSIGLNTTWNFFSPDPAHTMFLKYVVYFQDEYGNQKQDPIVSYYPENIKEHNFRMDQRRLSYVMRFLAIEPARLEKYFVPWVCRQYPGATHVQTEIEIFRIPPLDVVTTLKSENYYDLVHQEQMNSSMYVCVQ